MVSGRERLPDERQSITHKFSVGGHEGYLTLGFYDDGRPGELFVHMAKAGSTINGLMDVVATSVSIGLQHGVPIDDYVRKYSYVRFEPSGFTASREIQTATSIIDYIFRWVGRKCCPEVIGSASPLISPLEERVSLLRASSGVGGDAPACSSCGTLMVRTGHCHTCPACGESGGCG